MRMTYEEALKKLNAKKPKDNFLIVEMEYGKRLVLPYKDGLEFLSAIARAEHMSRSYEKPVVIQPIEQSTIRVEVLSATDYERYKIAQLLGISLEELQTQAETAETPTT